MKVVQLGSPLVVYRGSQVVKWFWGVGGKQLRGRQLRGYKFALKSRVWGKLVLEPKSLGGRWIIEPRASQPPHNWSSQSFVANLVRSSINEGYPSSYDALASLHQTTRLLGWSVSAVPELFALTSNARLPAGPTHGDFHHENLLFLRSRPCVVDVDRFDLHGCPLIDWVHFELSLQRRKTPGPWLKVLLESQLLRTIPYQSAELAHLFAAYVVHRIRSEAKKAQAQKKSLAYFRRLLQSANHSASQLGSNSE